VIKGFSTRILHNPLPADAAALMQRARSKGANAIAIIPHHYVYLEPGAPNLAPPPPEYRIPWFVFPDIGQDAAHPFANTPSPDTVYQLAREAESQGLQVMLKPHVDSYYGAWRGYISVKGRAADFRYAYRERFLRRYIQIAKSLKDPILCLGCELYTVTKELGAEFWVDMARWVRSRYGGGYSGRLTYAANWGVGPDAEYNRLAALWPSLDYVGIDAYFPLPLPMLAAWDAPMGTQGWEPTPAGDCLRAAEEAGRPLLFTEIGCGNYAGANLEPYADPPQGAVRDDELQAAYYRAFRERFDGEPRYAGFFNWEAWLGAQQPVSHSIVGRPAEDVAFR
jgi:hypothetical protein